MAEPPSLRARALRMLARREYSRQELNERLIASGADTAEIGNVLDEFDDKGWLSEKRFVDAVVQARRRRFGTVKVLTELKAKGVSEEGLVQAREALAKSEVESARSVWQKKFRHKPASFAERARQTRFLQGRGFSHEVIRQVLDGHDD